MARIPLYSGPKVDRQVERAQLADPSRMSLDNSRGVEKLGAAVIDAGLRMKDQADDVAVMEKRTQLAEIENRLLYDKDNGAFTKRGKNSFGTLEEVNAAYDKAYSDIEGTLMNEDQKRKLRQSYMTSRVDINRQLNRHISAQAQEYDTTTTTASLEVEQRAVATNPLDTERRNQSLYTQKTTIDKYADRMGLPNEQRKLMLEDAENKTNLGAIQSLVDNKNYIQARSYFDDVKEHMTGDARTKAERLVKASTLDGESQAFADDVMKKNMTMGDAFKKANEEISDPELRKATISQIREVFSQQKEAESFNRENLNKQIANKLDRGTLWKDIPQSQKDAMNPSDRNFFESYSAERAKGKDSPSGSKLYYDTFTIATNPATREQFKKMDLYSTIYGRVSKSEFDELYKLQNGIRAGTAKDVQEADQLFSNKQIADQLARSNGVYASNDDSQSKQKTYLDFMSGLNRGVKNFELNTGKKATPDDVRKIGESLLIEKKVNNDWFGSTKRRFETSPTENGEIEFRDIPENEVAAIRKAADAERVSLSDADVLEIYTRRLNGR